MRRESEGIEIDAVESGFDRLQKGDEPLFLRYSSVVEKYQKKYNPVYRRFEGFKYLPVSAFKYSSVATFKVEEAEAVFESSGTGAGSIRSKHFVRRLSVYQRSITTHFSSIFGPGPFTLMAHLPHYEDLGLRSSLVYMVQHLVRSTGTAESSFFMQDLDVLRSAVDSSERDGRPVLLIGAAFGLLDLLDQEPIELPPSTIVIETGGMKTFRREIDRPTLHQKLAHGFGLERNRIRSEYGMCELLSQCYSDGTEIFYPPPWMRFEILDPDNPERALREGETGLLAIIDLANMYSVSAIMTEDLAVQRDTGFEVLGRLDHADLRGCNFLFEA